MICASSIFGEQEEKEAVSQFSQYMIWRDTTRTKTMFSENDVSFAKKIKRKKKSF